MAIFGIDTFIQWRVPTPTAQEARGRSFLGRIKHALSPPPPEFRYTGPQHNSTTIGEIAASPKARVVVQASLALRSALESAIVARVRCPGAENESSLVLRITIDEYFDPGVFRTFWDTFGFQWPKRSIGVTVTILEKAGTALALGSASASRDAAGFALPVLAPLVFLSWKAGRHRDGLTDMMRKLIEALAQKIAVGLRDQNFVREGGVEHGPNIGVGCG